MINLDRSKSFILSCYFLDTNISILQKNQSPIDDSQVLNDIKEKNGFDMYALTGNETCRESCFYYMCYLLCNTTILRYSLFLLKLRGLNLKTHVNIKICIKIWIF